MSVVTDVIITASLLEQKNEDDDDIAALIFINNWLMETSRGRLRRLDAMAGGRKAMQAVVLMGAFNFLDADGFIACVDRAPWERREYVQLLMKEEQEDCFTIRWARDENVFVPSGDPTIRYAVAPDGAKWVVHRDFVLPPGWRVETA